MTFTSPLSDPNEERKAKNREKQRRWREKNPAQGREWYRQNAESHRSRKLKRLYGITLEQRDEILTSQGGCCAVCKADAPGTKKGWHVDHCHTSEQVRGVLCHHCNLMLGYARDNPTILSSAISYLDNFNGREA